MNFFLLIAGDAYYPQHDTNDWKKTFATKEEAEKAVSKIEHKEIVRSGKNKGKEVVVNTTYKIGESEYDWYEIVDLRDWIFDRKV